MHGGHYFDKNNKEDLNLLELWKAKSYNRLYQSAIDTWTKYDLIKRDIANEHNLNYIVLWNLNDIQNYIKSL